VIKFVSDLRQVGCFFRVLRFNSLYLYLISTLEVSQFNSRVCDCSVLVCLIWFMVFNPTFKNISGISWWSVLLLEETGVPGENYQPVVSHWQTLSHNVVSSVNARSYSFIIYICFPTNTTHVFPNPQFISEWKKNNVVVSVSLGNITYDYKC
jgi:hypothetical protein